MATQTATPTKVTAPVAASPKPTTTTTAPKRTRKYEITEEGSVVTFTFPSIKKVLSIDVKGFGPDLAGRAQRHGVKQRVCDAAAGVTSELEAYEEMKDIADSLLSGVWSTRKAGEPRIEPIERLAAAVAEVRKVSVEKALAFLNAATEDIRKAIAKSDKVAPVIARMKSAVKSDDVLGGLV